MQNQEISGNLLVFLPLINSELEDIGEGKMQARSKSFQKHKGMLENPSTTTISPMLGHRCIVTIS